MPPLGKLASAALLLAAQLNEVQATRVAAVKSSSKGAQQLRVQPADNAPLNPTRMAAAVADLFHGMGSNKSTPLAFQTVCADLMASKVDGLDKAFTDMHVKAAVSDACDQRKLFANTSSTVQHKNCTLFAEELAGARRAHLANSSDSSYSKFCQDYTALALAPAGAPGDHPVAEDPEVAQMEQEEEAMSFLISFLVQFIFGAVYWFTVVSQYPMITGDKDIPEKVKILQSKNEVTGLGEVTPSVCLMSFCCPAVRMSHNLHSTDTLNYWASLCVMTCFPGLMCCAVFLSNSCTPMNEKLGGERREIILGLLCAWCCQCCVIAQDAESMDMIVGRQTGICSSTDVVRAEA